MFIRNRTIGVAVGVTSQLLGFASCCVAARSAVHLSGRGKTNGCRGCGSFLLDVHEHKRAADRIFLLTAVRLLRFAIARTSVWFQKGVVVMFGLYSLHSLLSSVRRPAAEAGRCAAFKPVDVGRGGMTVLCRHTVKGEKP
jgi:hypothetical protein